MSKIYGICGQNWTDLYENVNFSSEVKNEGNWGEKVARESAILNRISGAKSG